MKKKLFSFTDALSTALKKGAHARETTQQRFVTRALCKELKLLANDEIDALVDEHEANEATYDEQNS